MPILDIYLPKTNFGPGIPDINATRLISYLLILVFLFDSAIKKRMKLFSKWTFTLIIYSAIVLLSVSWSKYSYSLNVVQKIFNSVFLPLMIAIIALNIFREKYITVPFLKNIIFASVVLSLISMYQFFSRSTTFGEWVRGAATMGNPNALAIFLVLILPLTIYALEKQIIPIMLGFPLLALVAGGILSTLSRKGIITAALTLFIYFFQKRQFKKIAVLSFCAGMTLLTLAAFSLDPGRLGPDKFDADIGKKWNLTYAGLQMFVTSPIIGLGYEGYYENSPPYTGFPYKYDAHNIFITALTNYGVIGFIPFLGIFLYPLAISRRTLSNTHNSMQKQHCKNTALICFCSVIPFMVSGYFAGGLFYKESIVFLLYSNIAMFLARCDDKNKDVRL